MSKHFLSYLEDSIRKYWNNPVVSDFDGEVSLTYGEMANQIARFHVLFDSMGLKKGDKVALCANNCAHWAVSYMALTTYEVVVVSILPDFQPESVQALVNHSDAKLLIVGSRVWEHLDSKEMPNLSGIISMKDFGLIESKSDKLTQAFQTWESSFNSKYPQGIKPEDINYPKDNMDDLCLINYTSGTTSDPKGVMLSYRSISSNTQYGLENIPTHEGYTIVSMLPLAHMFGLAFEFIYPMAGGCHINFLNKTPSPQVLMKALSDVKPYILITVPLVIEKIFKKMVFPVINKPIMKVLWYTPGIGRIIKNTIKKKLLTAFGGKLDYLVVGGAALNGDVEKCLRAIKFPYTVGYGMTECGPLIAYRDWRKFAQKSCGCIVDRMSITIDSANPEKEVGEIMVKGDNVMLGYYKNQAATDAVMTKDGWMRTGDLGVIDKKGNVFIKGRSKSMILGSSGQNIYPEEIEDKLNGLPLVVESVVLQRNEKIVAMVYPDYDEAKRNNYNEINLRDIMEENRVKLNKLLPTFCRVFKVELVQNEFEKTPKRSIKRFLYK